MHKKFEVNRTKIKGDCQSERKAAEMISYSKMPLVCTDLLKELTSILMGYFNLKSK